ncbi:MAG: hypothetical protein IJP33_03490 [Firmicutes bacterium]|nr:hypothetical protein [Bacillota bacterium]
MKKLFFAMILFVLLLCFAACGDTTPVITDINILDENGTEIAMDELGIARSEKCTVEVFFKGSPAKISFYAVTEDENGELDGEFLASADVGRGIERALYDWELPFGFTGYIWAVLDEQLDDFSENNSRAISSVMQVIAPYVVFSCEYKGASLQVMLYQPVEKGAHGIWAVESYKDAAGIHPFVFVGNEYIKTAQDMYELDQNNSNILGGDPAFINPEDVALNYLKEELDFVPESYELRNQNDNSYE